MLYRFNVFKEDTNRVAENHRSLFDQQAEELKRLDRIQEEFKQLQQEKITAIHELIQQVSNTFQTNLQDTRTDIESKMGTQEAEAMKRHEKVEETLADLGKEVEDLDRRSTKAETNIRNNQAAIQASREEMEAGFSEVQEKQRVNEQTHQTIKTDLSSFQDQTSENISCINTRLQEIGEALETNTKDHDTFVHDINKNKVNLSKYEEETKMELASINQNHEELKSSHERLSEEVEENTRLERENTVRVNKNLRELANHAETIERNLEILDSEVKKNESSRKNNETSINNKLELITSKQGQYNSMIVVDYSRHSKKYLYKT